MKLGDILQGVLKVETSGQQTTDVTGLCHDFRQFQPGHLFIAIKGFKTDGHQFIPEACNKGASGVVVEDKSLVPLGFSGGVIKVPDSRIALDKIADNFFGQPSRSLFSVGVTGTNGKTTTAYMIECILNGNKVPAGVVGTIDYHFGQDITPSTHSTPGALELQRLLASWLKQGAKAVAMEVTSHALALGRVDSVAFDVAVFTNLTRDHLDFHGTMEEYKKTKMKLFRNLLKNSVKKNIRAIINGDDPAGVEMTGVEIPTWTFGFNQSDLMAKKVSFDLDGTHFEAVTPAGPIQMSMQMIGRHNILNSLAAIGVGLHRGLPLEGISRALSQLRGVKGRLERVPSTNSRVRAFVDYAHTDDALHNALGFLKKLRDETSPSARIITVFGCGGDRDKGKRPLMLKAALEHSDFVIVTSDNPRTEDPCQIVSDILSGEDRPPKVTIEMDRKKAIELALMSAKPYDVVLIAGKGHEDYQIIGTTKYPFDDTKIAKEILDS